jgi:hypothetical protein
MVALGYGNCTCYSSLPPYFQGQPWPREGRNFFKDVIRP